MRRSGDGVMLRYGVCYFRTENHYIFSPYSPYYCLSTNKKNMIQNKLWIGLLIGLLVPFVGYALLLTIYDQLDAMGWTSSIGFSANFRVRTLGVIAICLNLIPLNLFQRRRFGEAVRGIAVMTVIYAIAWVIYFGNTFFK